MKPTGCMPSFLAGTLASLLIPSLSQAAPDDPQLISFDRQRLTETYYSEGIAAGDLNGDGSDDIVYGPHWFAGPDFQQRHEIYPAKPQPREGYADHFFCWVDDFDRDGRPDVLVVGFPGTPAYVYENPGVAEDPGRPWKKHQVFDWVGNESPQFVDVVGDGRRELVCTREGMFGFVTIDPARPFSDWAFHPISEKMAAERFGHGLASAISTAMGGRTSCMPAAGSDNPQPTP